MNDAKKGEGVARVQSHKLQSSQITQNFVQIFGKRKKESEYWFFLAQLVLTNRLENSKCLVRKDKFFKKSTFTFLEFTVTP